MKYPDSLDQGWSRVRYPRHDEQSPAAFDSISDLAPIGQDPRSRRQMLSDALESAARSRCGNLRSTSWVAHSLRSRKPRTTLVRLCWHLPSGDTWLCWGTIAAARMARADGLPVSFWLSDASMKARQNGSRKVSVKAEPAAPVEYVADGALDRIDTASRSYVEAQAVSCAFRPAEIMAKEAEDDGRPDVAEILRDYVLEGLSPRGKKRDTLGAWLRSRAS